MLMQGLGNKRISKWLHSFSFHLFCITKPYCFWRNWWYRANKSFTKKQPSEIISINQWDIIKLIFQTRSGIGNTFIILIWPNSLSVSNWGHRCSSRQQESCISFILTSLFLQNKTKDEGGEIICLESWTWPS